MVCLFYLLHFLYFTDAIDSILEHFSIFFKIKEKFLWKPRLRINLFRMTVSKKIDSTGKHFINYRTEKTYGLFIFLSVDISELSSSDSDEDFINSKKNLEISGSSVTGKGCNVSRGNFFVQTYSVL